MNAWLMREHLAEAERHIALSDKHIARQTEIIDELKSAGHSTVLALNILESFQTMRAAHIAHRDAIRKELTGGFAG